MRVINKLIIHCSDTPDTRWVTVDDIDEWHSTRFKRSSNGRYCGYHWVIYRDGTIVSGRMESDIGAHCAGHNKDSIGICLIGRGKYSQDQWQSLYWFLTEKCIQYGLEAKQVFGHREFNNKKTCPNIDDLEKLRDDLEVMIQGG